MKQGQLIYLTGLSGSGKTTLATELQKIIPNSILLDGDIIRSTISTDLGYDKDSKVENIRRNNELINMLYNQGFVIIAAFMASISSERDKIFNTCLNNIKIQLTTPLDECIKRDVKGLYKLTPANLSGVNFKYSGFDNYDIAIDTTNISVYDSISTILDTIKLKDKQ
jgi:adenylylsulfate kinase-like enzyme